MKNFSQNFVKNALCGVVGSERVFKRVWETSQQAKSVRQAIARTGRFTEMGTRFLCLLRNLSLSKYGKEGKRMDWELCHATETARRIRTRKGGTAHEIGAIPPNLKLLPSNCKHSCLLDFLCIFALWVYGFRY